MKYYLYKIKVTIEDRLEKGRTETFRYWSDRVPTKPELKALVAKLKRRSAWYGVCSTGDFDAFVDVSRVPDDPGEKVFIVDSLDYVLSHMR